MTARRTADGSRVRLLFQDIIRRASLEAFNRRLLANRARNQDERRVRTLLLCHRHRLQPGERRQVIIRDDDVEGLRLQLLFERRAVANAFDLGIELVLLQTGNGPTRQNPVRLPNAKCAVACSFHVFKPPNADFH